MPTTTFRLPDLGEGLPEAEIVTWHVREGQQVSVDQLLVSVETAKAVVEVPSPVSGTVRRLYADEGEIVPTGSPLVDFEQTDAPGSEPAAAADPGTVVGQMPSSDDVLVESARAGSRSAHGSHLRASPAARALAAELGVELTAIAPSGSAGQVTPEDVRAHAAAREQTPAASAGPWRGGALRGPRRAMARSMTASRQQVVPCTVFDDADIQGWREPRAITERLLRAIVAGCHAEPALNGFFDAEAEQLEAAERVDIAMAVDTPDGLIVPVVRDAAAKSLAELRVDVDRIKQATRERSVRPEGHAGLHHHAVEFRHAGRALCHARAGATDGRHSGSRHVAARSRGGAGGHRSAPSHPAVADLRPPLRHRRRGLPVPGRRDRGSAEA
jgi:2-oxoisovalerate dehydrogenase E2 component (dihydrolipoyl transacylase)